jgi:hypothetical protein
MHAHVYLHRAAHCSRQRSTHHGGYSVPISYDERYPTEIYRLQVVRPLLQCTSEQFGIFCHRAINNTIQQQPVKFCQILMAIALIEGVQNGRRPLQSSNAASAVTCLHDQACSQTKMLEGARAPASFHPYQVSPTGVVARL